MTRAELRNQALQLTEPERLALAEELWASIEDPNAHPQAVVLPKWQQDLLDERLEETANDPGETWEQVRANLWPNSQ